MDVAGYFCRNADGTARRLASPALSLLSQPLVLEAKPADKGGFGAVSDWYCVLRSWLWLSGRAAARWPVLANTTKRYGFW